jgi:hypothetical protein
MRNRLLLSGGIVPAGLIVAAVLSPACGSSQHNDDPFAAATNDESASEAEKLVTTSNDGGPLTDGGQDDGGPPPPPPPPPPPDAGPPPFDGGPSGLPSGFWHFDDCSTTSTVLVDSSGNGANATHKKKSSCVPGISGLGVQFKSTSDIVQVADAPEFAVNGRVAAAAWINPSSVKGDHPIVLKRKDNKTSFSLGIHDGHVEFAVVLTDGTTVSSRAPINPNVWTHVGGFYDGQFVFLFLNGQQVGQTDQPGKARNVAAPIRIGATTQTQHFDGIIDEVWISTNQVSASDIQALSCIHKPSTFTVASPSGGPFPFDATEHYTVTVSDNDVGSCQPTPFFFQIPSGGGGGDAGTSNDGINTSVNPQFTQAQPGQSIPFDVAVTGTEDADPGHHDIPFSVFGNFLDPPLNGSLGFDLAAPSGCFVSTKKELMIRDTSVVDDPVRTAFTAPADNPHRGVWTFGRIMRDMAATPADAEKLTHQLFNTWLTDQTVNGFTVAARPSIQSQVLDSWPKLPDGTLDLDQAPLRLLAIVNRVDTRDLSKNSAGEGRFVFGVLGAGGFQLQFTVIVEFHLAASSEADVLGWANAWHALSTHPFPSEEYNNALEALTLKFSGRGVAPERPNGSGLDQLRTNEIALSTDFRWQLRQFELSATSGLLEPRPVSLTPDLGFNGSPTLAQYINQNEALILAEKHTVPLQFNGAPFQAGAIFNDLTNPWTAPGINNSEARFHFALNTCNGCHGSVETNTVFLQISPRSPGQVAPLSAFLTGTTVNDPVSGVQRTLNDLSRRKTDLTSLVCPAPGVATQKVHANIVKGIQRVH